MTGMLIMNLCTRVRETDRSRRSSGQGALGDPARAAHLRELAVVAVHLVRIVANGQLVHPPLVDHQGL